MHDIDYSWVVKIRNISEALGLGQYDGLGAYCGLSTASSYNNTILSQLGSDQQTRQKAVHVVKY